MTFSFLDYGSHSRRPTEAIARRVVTRRSLDYGVHRSVFPSQVWDMGVPCVD